MTIVAIGLGCWAKSTDIGEAIKNCKKHGSLRKGDKIVINMYTCEPNELNGGEMIEYPAAATRYRLGYIIL